ncbi:MAG TPA: hypothetical protein VEX37_06980 [Thermomicrobiales bacterium]|nr:hypothetical protein [Thermomicrobiales bacterium]
MTQSNIRQSIVRLAAIVALTTGLLISTGITAAAQTQVGLRECDRDTCAVVTTDDLKAARAERGLTVYRPMPFPTDRFGPHFIP